jgi:hypothetical protein
MSIGPRYGVCLHCGHDHGQPGEFKLPRSTVACHEELSAEREKVARLEGALRGLVKFLESPYEGNPDDPWSCGYATACAQAIIVGKDKLKEAGL